MAEAAIRSRRAPGAAALVASGIFLSRIAGLIRESVFAHYFGNTAIADAFKAALRIPNFLQNLFGEGVLSASFIPVYAGLLAREKREEAGRVAGAVFALLGTLMSLLVLAGVLATPLFIDAIAPGFHGSKRSLTITLVRILFPSTGLLVMSAWCLGILNSHRRFFLSYSVPVLWNIAMIGALAWFGPRRTPEDLAVIVAWASVVGSAAQLIAQMPVVLTLVPALRIGFAMHLESVHTVVRNFGPVFISRGVVQLSAYIDQLLASLLGDGAFSGLGYAQTIYLLPVSLFGMAVSASELPAMSSAVGREDDVSRVESAWLRCIRPAGEQLGESLNNRLVIRGNRLIVVQPLRAVFVELIKPDREQLQQLARVIFVGFAARRRLVIHHVQIAAHGRTERDILNDLPVVFERIFLQQAQIRDQLVGRAEL